MPSLKDMAASIPIAEASKQFTDSYARAMELASHKSFKPSDRSIIAKALSSHFGLTNVFIHGEPPFSVGKSTDMAMNMERHLGDFEKAGIGYDIFCEKSRIENISENNAACFITWRIRPAAGSNIEAWSWENLYMYRRGGAFDPKDEQFTVGFTGEEWTVPEGRWEAVFSDNEMDTLLSRFPNFRNM